MDDPMAFVDEAVKQIHDTLNQKVEERCQTMVDFTHLDYRHTLRMERYQMDISMKDDSTNTNNQILVVEEPLPRFWCDLPATNLHPNWYL